MKTVISLAFGLLLFRLADSAQQNNANSYFYYQQSDYPKDCSDIKRGCSDQTKIKNGVYYIKPEGLLDPIEVYCDHESDNGGWTVIQRRMDGDTLFNRNITHYRKNFGFLHKSYWMGLTDLSYLVNQRKYSLKINITTSDGTVHTAKYNWFRISDAKSDFQLVHLEGFTGTGLTDEMENQAMDSFYGIDGRCSRKSGWWFDSSCSPEANLNGVYGGTDSDTKLKWGDLENIEHVTMEVRPQDFA